MDKIRQKLLVLLGAGSSLPFGMPSVRCIDGLMKDWSSEGPLDPSVHSNIDVFKVLWETSEQYYTANHYCIRPNYERVLAAMTALAMWLSPPPFGNSTIDTFEWGSPFGALRRLRESSDEFSARRLVVEQHDHLMSKLACHIRDLCRPGCLDLSGLSDYVEFLRALREHFDVGVYNLNYDTIASTAWPQAFNGFDDRGDFDPLAISERQEWGFIYHLHGNVHHSIRPGAAGQLIRWQDDLDGDFVDCGKLQPDMAHDFAPISLSTLISGGFKLDRLLAEPYHTFHSILGRHVHEADAILIVGYGFGDLHVNRAIQNRFELAESDEAPYPNVVVVEKSSPQRYRTGRLEGHQFWSWQMTHTLKTTFRNAAKFPSEDDRRVADIIAREECEIDLKKRVFLWHGGVSNAARAANRVIAWLAGLVEDMVVV